MYNFNHKAWLSAIGWVFIAHVLRDSQTLSLLYFLTTAVLTVYVYDVKYNSKPEKVVQIGCGVVGEAYSLAYKYYNFPIVGIDVQPDIIKKMKNHGIACYHANKVPDHVNADIILLSLPTPCDDGKKLEMKYLWSTIPTVTQLIEQSTGLDPIVVIRSTVPPGFSLEYEEELKRNTKKKFYISFQPEFLRAKSHKEDAINPWKVVFGVKEDENPEVTTRLTNAFLKFVDYDPRLVNVLTIKEAEIYKLIHNYFNALKISFANTMYGISHSIDQEIDIQKILFLVTETSEGMLNPKYGLKVGSPYMGTCLPKDSRQMHDLAPEGPLREFIASTIAVNEWIKNNDELKKDLDVSPMLMDHKSLKSKFHKKQFANPLKFL